MDVDPKYMSAAVEFSKTHSVKETLAEFPKMKHPNNLWRYQQYISGNGNFLKYKLRQLKSLVVTRALDEEANGGNVTKKQVRDWCNHFASEVNLTEKNHFGSTYIKKILDHIKGLKGGEPSPRSGIVFGSPVQNIHESNSRHEPLFCSFPQVLLIGDPLTHFDPNKREAWNSQLALSLKYNADVMDRGYFGYNSNYYLKIFPSLLEAVNSKQIGCVVIFMGANDAFAKDCPSGLHVPLHQFKQNLIQMVDMIQNKGISKEKIILVTPPTCDIKRLRESRQKRGDTLEIERMSLILSHYVKMMLNVAKKTQVELLNMYNVFKDKKVELDRLLTDRFHFSPAGSQEFLSHLQPVIIQKLCYHLGTSTLWPSVPKWTEMRDFHCQQNKE